MGVGKHKLLRKTFPYGLMTGFRSLVMRVEFWTQILTCTWTKQAIRLVRNNII